ncbi:MAG: formyltetrahydrofolate deformylase [Candidatus Omnitrophica bacterium]|nr:formyltetrahydrofolate deformylase [Candidatus Omnitrophota bacterium]
MNTYILLFQCRDQKGIIAKLADFIFKAGANIITADQYSTNPQGGYFFIRLEFVINSASIAKVALEKGLRLLAANLGAQFSLYDKHKPLRMGVCVSRPGHCLAEILYLWSEGELNVKIPFVVSNFKGHREFVKQHKIPFYFVPATKNNRRENALLKIIAENTDFLVLSRYMLVLSKKFLNAYGKDIINIHHGFLPSFKGSNPYKQALSSGVKVIGATSHFVTEKLDSGPIITQAVEYVSHKDGLEELVRKGRNLEKRALTDALRAYIDYRVIKHADKTIVF